MNIEIQDIASIVGPIVGAGAAGATLLLKIIDSRMSEAMKRHEEKEEKSFREHNEKTDEKLDEIRNDLHKAEVNTSERYAKKEELKGLGERMDRVLERLETKIDRIPEQIRALLFTGNNGGSR